MATAGTFCFDGANFAQATSLYTDSALTNLAPDGYYAQGTISRRQLNGILLAPVACSDCNPPTPPNPISCGAGIIIPQSTEGLYELNFSAGSGTGAISILFQPKDVPDGIRVLYDGVYYNRLSSPLDGDRQNTSGVSDAFTILGEVFNPVPGCVAVPQTFVLDYYNGLNQNPASWIPGTPSTKTVTTNVGDLVLGGACPPVGDCQYNLLIIPKPSAAPDNVKVEVIGTCFGTEFNLDVSCPAALPGFQGRSIGSSTGCTTANATFYFGRFRFQTNIYPSFNNPVFSDVNGEFRVSDGNYYMDNNLVVSVTSGVVSGFQPCS